MPPKRRAELYSPAITVWEDADAASLAAAYFFIETCHRAIASHGKFVVALAGGNTPKNLYRLLSKDEFQTNIPWNKVFVFLCDERFVPLNNEESNFRMIKENFLSRVPIPRKNVFAIPYRKSSKEAATVYEKIIRDFFQKDRRFDLILLGIGNDGHTASLFPNTGILKENKRLVKEVWLDDKQSWRISLTLPLINQAKQIMFLVTGKEKAEIVSKILEAKKKEAHFPAQLVKLKDGAISWIMDQEAAAKLR